MTSNELKWWQKAVIYEIYLKSFYDSDNNGIGDIQGIIKKLDYLKNIGVSTLWLTPFYPSNGKDGGYDVMSFVDIDSIYGTLKDFQELVEIVHKNDMYIIMDFVPNHTSTEHEWFKESCKSATNPYSNYYIWHPSSDKTRPPNNWISVFGEAAWTFCEQRQQWYFHQFLPSQPELNLRCPAVKKEIEDAIKFWVDEKNVDGLRIDSARFLYESVGFEDEPIKKGREMNINNLNYDDLDHIHTTNQPEAFETLIEWKQILDKIGLKNNREKFIVAESYEDDTRVLMQYYQYKNRQCCNFTFNFQFIKLNENFNVVNPTLKPVKCYSFNPKSIKELMDPWIENLREGFWTNWQVGNHDVSRIATRIGRENIDLSNALCLLLGGTATTYYGEEIGMENLPMKDLSFDECKDQFGKKYGHKYYKYYTRDYERTPMQWNSAENSGFTGPGVKTWLPIHENFKYLNVQDQLKDKHSHLNIFKDLVRLRSLPSFQWGSFKYGIISDQLFSFLRKAENNPKYLVAMNISNSVLTIDFSELKLVPGQAKVVYYIGKPTDMDLYDYFKIDKCVSMDKVQLLPRNCLIVSFD